MTAYVEYELDEETTILIEIPEEEAGGIVQASRRGDEPEVLKAEKKFSDALEGVRRSAISIKEKLDDLRADEVEVTFGLKTTGKLGNFAIAEVGVEANYSVKLKWENEKTDKTDERIRQIRSRYMKRRS